MIVSALRTPITKVGFWFCYAYQRTRERDLGTRKENRVPPPPPPFFSLIHQPTNQPTPQAKRGGLKDTAPDDLLCAVFEATLQRTGVDPKDIGDIVIGSVLGDSSQRAIQCRIAALLSGIPDTVPLHTVNRQCSSGLQAIASVAAAIKSGYYSVGLAGGVESMSTNPMAWEGGINPRIAENENAQNCLLPMGKVFFLLAQGEKGDGRRVLEIVREEKKGRSRNSAALFFFFCIVPALTSARLRFLSLLASLPRLR